MPVQVEQDDARFLVRLEGEIGLSDASGLKQALTEGFASPLKLHLDMRQVQVIDLTTMQLLETSSQQARRERLAFEVSLSETVEAALSGAGFGRSEQWQR